MAKKFSKVHTVDPTLPTRLIPTAGGDIRICLDIGWLIDSEAELIAAGHPDMQLLISIEAASASALRTFFVIAAHRFQPNLSVEALKALVTLPVLILLSNAISELWLLSMPAPKKREGGAPDPPPPAK